MPRPQNTTEFRQQLAEEFANILETKGLEWKQGWQEIGRPYNGITGRAYKGINEMWLGMISLTMGYDDPRWVTMTQIMDKGGKYHPGQKWHLQAGSKATYVEWWYQWDLANHKEVSWDEYNNAIKEEGRDSNEFSLRSRYTPVFHASMVEGMPELEVRDTRPDIAPAELVETLSRNMGVSITYGGGRSYYSPSHDTIHLPEPGNFVSDYDFNSTALHELAHATGHSTRLNRNMRGRFGSEQYAYEELVAEMSSAFMGACLDVQAAPTQVENHKAYLQSWIQTIREKPDTLVRAIRDAQATAEYMDKIVERSKEEKLAMAEKNDESLFLNEEINEIEKIMEKAERDNTPVTAHQETDARSLALQNLAQERGISAEKAEAEWNSLSSEDRASRMGNVWKDILAREDSSKIIYRLESNPRASSDNDRFMIQAYFPSGKGKLDVGDVLFIGNVERCNDLIEQLNARKLTSSDVRFMYVDECDKALEIDVDTVSIFQIKDKDELTGFLFESFSDLTRKGLTVDPKNYDRVYFAMCGPGTTPEDIYRRFNADDRPKDFEGHSLSMSDVIVLHRNGEDTAYYVDRIGFQMVPEFLKATQSETIESATMPNRYYDKALGLNGTAEELFNQVRNGYIESPEALTKVQEILSNSIENESVKAMYVGFLAEAEKANPNLEYNAGQMKRDIYDLGHTDEYFLSNGLVMDARTDTFEECEQVKGCNVIISLVDTQGGQVGGDTIPIEDFYKMSESEFESRINQIYAYNMSYAEDIDKAPSMQIDERQANIECANAIENAIDANYNEYQLSPEGAKSVVNAYGIDRVEHVLAAQIRNHDWDGRYSIDNKSWSTTKQMDDHSQEYALNHAHPGLINLFTDQVRNIERQQMMEKTKAQERQITHSRRR